MSVSVNVPIAGASGQIQPASVNWQVAGGKGTSGPVGPQALKFNSASNSMYIFAMISIGVN